MATQNEMVSINKTARYAGFLYIVVAILGGFSILYVSSALIVSGDAEATAQNILASEGLFRIGLVSGLVTQALQIGLVFYLFQLLKTVNRNQAWLMVIFSLVGIPIAMLNLLNNYAGLILASGADYLSVFSTSQLQALSLFFLEIQGAGVSIAAIFWGLWLLPLGYLVFRSGYIPKILGILLIIGGLGYLVDFGIFFLFPTLAVEISQYTFLGELLLPLWLLIKGVDVEQWKERSGEQADSYPG